MSGRVCNPPPQHRWRRDGAVDGGVHLICGMSQPLCGDGSGLWGPVWIRQPPDISCSVQAPGLLPAVLITIVVSDNYYFF